MPQDSKSKQPRQPDISALPLGEIAAALRLTTETLASELARPGPVAPDWSPLQWRVAIAVAAMHGVSPLLAGTLRWRGPELWNDFLSQQLRHTEARHVRIERLLAGIDAGARRSGIALIALKGAALHRLSYYRPGERPMSDIDLLARAEDQDRCAELLCSLGYGETASTTKHRVFERSADGGVAALGEHPDNPIKIELHERIAERLPRNMIEITPGIWPGMVTPGINPYASVAALFSHLLLHAAGNMTVRSLRLLQVHDLALLCRRMQRADWDRLSELRVGGVGPWWALPPLELVGRYYSVVPADVIGTLRGHCHWRLARSARRQVLSDVSLSSLWVRAFPGLVWARGVPGQVGYLMRRVWPDRAALSARGTAPTVQPWLADAGWQRKSQLRRIVEWAASPQPNPASLYALRAALQWRN